MNIYGQSGLFQSNAPEWVKHRWREAHVTPAAPRGTTRFASPPVTVTPWRRRGTVDFPLDMLQVPGRDGIDGLGGIVDTIKGLPLPVLLAGGVAAYLFIRGMKKRRK